MQGGWNLSPPAVLSRLSSRKFFTCLVLPAAQVPRTNLACQLHLTLASCFLELDLARRDRFVQFSAAGTEAFEVVAIASSAGFFKGGKLSAPGYGA
jgi:hypothetical protein